jgi:hypothetical protein
MFASVDVDEVEGPRRNLRPTNTRVVTEPKVHPEQVEVLRMSDIEQTGAIDWLLLEAHDKAINGELVPPLLDLVDRRLIRILDVLILIKRGEGDFDTLTTFDLDTEQVGDLGALAGASSGLLSDEDASAAAAALDPDTIGLLIVYENLWSLPFAIAARKAGGQLVAQGHIPTQAIVAALDALES